MSDAPLPTSAQAQDKLRDALREFLAIDDRNIDLVTVLTDEAMFELHPSEDGLDEAVAALRRHAVEQQCDRCGSVYGSAAMKLNYTRISKGMRTQMLHGLEQFRQDHMDTAECPEHVTGKLPFGPTKLFRDPQPTA